MSATGPKAVPQHKHTNRLIHESSPYLLQHAHNPVDWYPWGTEAFEAARRQNKPIFLSVGYSTCYWCHVMERQSFENEQIAAEMNQRYINIKVDREERPDVDQLYMTAVQVLTRQGGWPMSVFLAPDLRPFYGGTYFPPTDGFGRPGFLTLLRGIDDAYQNRLADVEQTSAQLVQILQELAEPQPPESPVTIDCKLLASLVDRSTADYDAKLGGFGGAPKFPRQTLLEMLLVYLRETPDSEGRHARISSMLRRTLDAMAEGGIRDHLGGGFHRYSTDARWLVPHFEIMLYDNAMLGWVYAEAGRQFREQRYAGVARGIFDFVLREMTSPDGAFYTALDAEVDAMEGASYLWTTQETQSLLGEDDARIFNRVYGLDRGPNFADPHHGTGQPDRNVLFLPGPLEAVAADLQMPVDELEARLHRMRQKLYAARRQRKQPMLDTKIITSWNALMIRALAFAGRTLPEERYTAAAARAADFLMKRHCVPGEGLWRTSRDATPRHPGFLDDYAMFAHALLELSESPGQEHRRQQAASIAAQMLERFGDKENGGLYFTAADARDLIIRQKIGSDSPLPSGNAVAAAVLIELEQEDVARDIVSAYARHLESLPENMSAMLTATMHYLRENEPFTVSPGPWRGERPPSPQDVAAGVVDVGAAWLSERELHVQLGILGGFHINAHETSRDLLATQVSVSGDAGALVEEIEYPPGEEQSFAFAAAPIRVYSGAATVAVRFRQDMAGRPPVRLAVSYQACNADACFPPVTRQVEIATP